jgi:hypothetical protein
MAVIVPFLAILLIGAIEMAQAFTVYIALINATRAGASYAQLYPEVRNCANPPGSDTSAISDQCIEYSERVKDEILAIASNGFGFIDAAELEITPPTMYSPSPPTVYANCPITSTLAYNLHTVFTSSMSMPLFGRMGLPNAYTLRYSTGMPIREAEDQHDDCLSYTPS